MKKRLIRKILAGVLSVGIVCSGFSPVVQGSKTEAALKGVSVSSDSYAGDSIREAQNKPALPEDVSISGTVTKEDFYKIQINEAGSIDCVYKSDNTVLVTLYDEDGMNIKSLHGNQIIYLAKGTYYISVGKWLYDATYTLKMKFYSANETYTYDKDTIRDAMSNEPIDLNTEINGQFSLNDKEDYYKVEVVHSGELEYSFKNINGGSTFINLYDADGMKIKNLAYTSSKDDSVKLTEGTYYIGLELSGPVPSYGSYKLELHFYEDRVPEVTPAPDKTPTPTPTPTKKPTTTPTPTKKPTTASTPNKPAQVSISKVTTPTKKQMVVSWKKVSGASGYYVKYSTASNMKGAKKKKVGKKTSKLKLVNLTSGKKYYVQVCAYAKGSKVVYGKWSKAKSIKVK